MMLPLIYNYARYSQANNPREPNYEKRKFVVTKNKNYLLYAMFFSGLCNFWGKCTWKPIDMIWILRAFLAS